MNLDFLTFIVFIARNQRPSKDRSKPLSTAGGRTDVAAAERHGARERRGTTRDGPGIENDLAADTGQPPITHPGVRHRQQRIRMTEPHPANDDYEGLSLRGSIPTGPDGSTATTRDSPRSERNERSPADRRGFVFESGSRYEPKLS